MADHNIMELMICAASRLLEDRSTISVGTSAPCAAAMLAQKTHAPNLVIFFEAGGVAPILPRMPISVGDSRTFHRGIMTSPGFLAGGDSRERAGLPPGSGPYRVITDMAIMDFEPTSRRMRVISLHPGRGFEEVQENCGFELLRAETIEQTPEPTPQELTILRTQVDPARYIIGRA